jgi:hypothetical protein
MLLWLLVPACAPEKKPAKDEPDPADTSPDPADTGAVPLDVDQDGYVAAVAGGDDCDDTDAAVNPGATEVCDGVDNDCNGITDEAGDPTTWYEDADQDGYGDDYSKAVACTPPDGYTDVGGDCDDGDAAVNPGAMEVCDAADTDEDCDGYADSEDDSVTGGTTYWTDADGDGYGNPATAEERCEGGTGYADNADDCDDGDAAVSPMGTESCNGVDDDCNGTTDDGSATTTFYADADGDGFGDPDSTTAACDAPDGYTTDSRDCDDSRSDVHPGGSEVCDATDTDEDCDGYADDDDSYADGKSYWATDADGDGYGVSGSLIQACDKPSGYASVGGDCDDTDPAINPGAIEECDAADVDEDCDGYSDDDDSSVTGTTTYYEDADGDGYGDGSSSADYCTQPGGWVANDDDCDDGSAATYPGASETCGNGGDEDCDGADAVCGVLSGTVDLSTDAELLVGETAGDAAGYAVDLADDIDGDGTPDMLVGAYSEDSGGSGAGRVYVAYGRIFGTDDLSTADVQLDGDDAGDAAGTAVARGGGTSFWVGAPGGDVAYLLSDPGSGTLSSEAVATLTGESSGDLAGAAVAGGFDADADGNADGIVGAPYNDGGGSAAGRAYLLYGTPSSGDLADADVLYSGENAGDLAGTSLAAGDLDGDGTDDLLIGAPGHDGGGSYSGRVYVIYAPGTSDVDLALADATLTGVAAGDLAGDEVRVVGDLDSDGLDDIGVGAEGADDGGKNAGLVAIFFGAPTGASSLSAADVLLVGEAAGDYAGWSLSAGGDVDADGADDVLVGAYGGDRGTGGGGNVYLRYGPLSPGSESLADADAFLVGKETSCQAGWSLAGGIDVDANGNDDIFTGAPALDSGGTDAGGAYLLYTGE